MQPLVHGADQLVVGHAGTPLGAWTQHDRGVEHVERCIVGSGVGPANGAEDGGNLRKRANDPILPLHQRNRLGHRDARKSTGHIERRAFIERGHELAAKAEVERNGCCKERQIQDDHQLPVPQTPAENRQIKRLCEARGRILRLGFQLAAEA